MGKEANEEIWKIKPLPQIPQWLVETLQVYTSASEGNYLARLLWQRGMSNPETIAGFLDPDCYQPSSPFAFGQEMKWAIARLQKARQAGEKLTIWGDFDADGITATSVLWEGLGQFFSQHQQLNYYIPDRNKESHGLNNPGIEKLARSGTKLIVTCDTGSTNLKEIDLANELGIDIIITDHHTLPLERPSVVSIINPRYFANNHPLYNLSGVAVAYKLVEAMYETLPDLPQQPLEELLDLVAIGLIADLVNLSGDCRYLAQKGIKHLQKQTKNPTRPGVARLLELCQKTGDRPTDISFGIGPRINAVSRIQGDASYVVELLTSRDRDRTNKLALETELANTRRKALQKEITEDVKKKLAGIDLSTTSAIVLEDPQWQGGVLGLVAGQIASEYGRPTILLTSGGETEKEIPMARGSARSVNNIDLYELVESQAHLLHRFGGHPYAAGLSLPVENIPLFREGINQQLRQKLDINLMAPTVEIDLIVTVKELGPALFKELKLLEPCGMGNPIPKLLIKNCRFAKVWNKNLEDKRGKKVQYIRTKFEIWDDSVEEGFPGVWWGHYREEIPTDRLCDAVVELDVNTYEKQYEVRLIALRVSDTNIQLNSSNISWEESIIDWRGKEIESDSSNGEYRLLQKCPTSWDEIHKELKNAIAEEQKLVLAYSFPKQIHPQQIWEKLVGIAKYLSRTGKSVTSKQLRETLELSDRSLNLGFQALRAVGFELDLTDESIKISCFRELLSSGVENTISLFLWVIEEEQFQREYFFETPLSTLQQTLNYNHQ